MADRKVSESPGNRSFSNKISAIGAKISRTLSSDATLGGDDREPESVLSEKNRSVSRGRDVYQSSGRGGIGNIRSTSVSRERRPEDGPDDFSHSRGREPGPGFTQMGKNFSTGRGGAGNIRSPSRDAPQSPLTPELRERALAEEERIIKAHAAAELDAPHSTGRGGAGNIIPRSRSRGRASTQFPLVHSTGRGGAGNIVAGEFNALQIEIEDEDERLRYARADGIHSTGRGGLANLTTIREPGIEKHEPSLGDHESTGRGGAGNIIENRSRSQSRSKLIR